MARRNVRKDTEWSEGGEKTNGFHAKGKLEDSTEHVQSRGDREIFGSKQHGANMFAGRKLTRTCVSVDEAAVEVPEK